MKWCLDYRTKPFLKWLYSNLYFNISIKMITSLPLYPCDSIISTKLCKSIRPFRQGKVLLAPARGTHGSREEKCPIPPTLHKALYHYSWNIHIFMWPGWSRQPPIGGDRIGPQQEMRFYWCDGSESGEWWQDGGEAGDVIGSIDPGRPQPSQMRARARTAGFQKIVILARVATDGGES